MDRARGARLVVQHSSHLLSSAVVVGVLSAPTFSIEQCKQQEKEKVRSRSCAVPGHHIFVFLFVPLFTFPLFFSFNVSHELHNIIDFAQRDYSSKVAPFFFFLSFLPALCFLSLSFILLCFFFYLFSSFSLRWHNFFLNGVWTPLCLCMCVCVCWARRAA